MKNTNTIPEKQLSRPTHYANPGPKVKKVVMAIEVGNSNLGPEVKRMFDLAKSSGLELDLTFSQREMQTA